MGKKESGESTRVSLRRLRWYCPTISRLLCQVRSSCNALPKLALRSAWFTTQSGRLILLSGRVLGYNSAPFALLSILFGRLAASFLAHPALETTVALVGLYVLAACPPPSVLGFFVASVAWGVYTTGIAAAFFFSIFATCGLMCAMQVTLQLTGVGNSLSMPQWLWTLAGYIGMFMRLPSSFCMNFFWTCPPILHAIPRQLLAVAFEALAFVLFRVPSFWPSLQVSAPRPAYCAIPQHILRFE
jgi:hypothetical protein